MTVTGPRPTRRTALALGAGTALAGALTLAGGTSARAADGHDAVTERLAGLEREYGARLGVYARNLRTGRTVVHRGDERFPICSVFKTIAVAAVLRDLDHDGAFLAERRYYTADDVTRAEHAPITKDHLATGMTVGELCDATIRYSDNLAANLLLADLGGPTAVTRFARSVGDGRTRLDRWEPDLNSAEPDRRTDTTTPRAIAGTYTRLVLGDALEPADRERLTGWLLRNTTSTERLRAGLPPAWPLADKTGGGSHGTSNDVGITWTPAGAPIVLAVFTTRAERDAPVVNPLIVRTAELLAGHLG